MNDDKKNNNAKNTVSKNWRDMRFTCEMFKVVKEGKTILDDPEVEVVDTFKVGSYQEAIAYASKYREDHADCHCPCFWRPMRSRGLVDCGLWHCDGICSWGESDVDCVFIDWIARTRVKMRKDKDLTNKRRWVRKIARIRRLSTCKVIRGLLWLWIKSWDCLSWHMWRRPINAFEDWRWRRRNFKNWRDTGHSLSEHWSLELHLLRDLKYNLKKLNEEGYGINMEFMYEVLRDKHPSESAEEIERRMNEIMMNSNRSEAEEVERLGMERQRETYAHIAHLVDLYTFYVNQEIDDHEPTKEDLTDDMHVFLVEGTYNTLDSKKMLDEGNKVWNEIWDLVKKYGQQMGD